MTTKTDIAPVPKMRIKECRKRAGLKQDFVAEFLGVEQPTVSRWESGVHVPDIPTCMRLAQLFKVPLMALFGDNMIDPELRDAMIYVQSHPRERGLILSPYKALRERDAPEFEGEP